MDGKVNSVKGSGPCGAIGGGGDGMVEAGGVERARTAREEMGLRMEGRRRAAVRSRRRKVILHFGLRWPDK